VKATSVSMRLRILLCALTNTNNDESMTNFELSTRDDESMTNSVFSMRDNESSTNSKVLTREDNLA
jgi:hypothetical protein